MLIRETGPWGLLLLIIEQLGLPPTCRVTLTLSDGSWQEWELYGELRVQVGDCDDVLNCVAKPE